MSLIRVSNMNIFYQLMQCSQLLSNDIIFEFLEVRVDNSGRIKYKLKSIENDETPKNKKHNSQIAKELSNIVIYVQVNEIIIMDITILIQNVSSIHYRIQY